MFNTAPLIETSYDANTTTIPLKKEIHFLHKFFRPVVGDTTHSDIQWQIKIHHLCTKWKRKCFLYRQISGAFFYSHWIW